MALEFSEVATLGCMFFSKKQLDDAVKNIENLKAFTLKVRDVVNNNSKVKFGTGKSAFINAMNPNDSKVLDDMVRGCSAAIAIKSWLQKYHNEKSDIIIKKGYMTGNVWPSPVNKFKISAFGMKDYNSSDIILYTGKSSGYDYYYGVSLKKKSSVYHPDPTLINKAFDSVMEGKNFDKLKDDIGKLRRKWFADRVRKADKKKLIKIEREHLKLPDSKLILAKPAGTKKPYPNIKGTLQEGYEDGNGFRKWMNREVGQGDLYTQMLKLVKPHTELFANSLVNLVLKSKLNDELNANKDLNDYYFGFALVTGIGYVRRNNVPDMGPGKVYPQESVLCAINHLANSKKKYTMKQVPNPAGDESDAAKVFFIISKGKVSILNLQVRYKGSFTAQPQFQASLTKEFKEILKGACLDI